MRPRAATLPRFRPPQPLPVARDPTIQLPFLVVPLYLAPRKRRRRSAKLRVSCPVRVWDQRRPAGQTGAFGCSFPMRFGALRRGELRVPRLVLQTRGGWRLRRPGDMEMGLRGRTGVGGKANKLGDVTIKAECGFASSYKGLYLFVGCPESPLSFGERGFRTNTSLTPAQLGMWRDPRAWWHGLGAASPSQWGLLSSLLKTRLFAGNGRETL